MANTTAEKAGTGVSIPLGIDDKMDELHECVVCGDKNSLQKKSFTVRDHALSGETFFVSKCTACTALLTDPRPTEQEIGKYYDFPDYISHRDDAPGLINNLYRLARRWTTRGKVALINSIKPPGSGVRKLLDYGSGTGYFLQAAAEAGWNITGIEVDTRAREKANERTEGKVVSNIDSLPEAGSYDVITLWHVLEHVHALPETVAKLIQRLSAAGTLVVAVPNPQSFDAKKYGAWWAAYDVPRHLYHFTPLSIEKLAKRHGAVIKQKIGQPLDSFYISLLSEKYRRGSAVRGLVNGLNSVISAWKTKSYSSIIYVINRDVT